MAKATVRVGADVVALVRVNVLARSSGAIVRVGATCPTCRASACDAFALFRERDDNGTGYFAVKMRCDACRAIHDTDAEVTDQ